jgi:hypothetical protein
MMTIKVYRAEGHTGRRIPIGTPVQVPSGDPERLKDDALRWPPCGCARCRNGAQ